MVRVCSPRQAAVFVDEWPAATALSTAVIPTASSSVTQPVSTHWNLRAAGRVEYLIGSACAVPEEARDEADGRVGSCWRGRGCRRRVGQEGGSSIRHRHDDLRQVSSAAGRLLPLRQRRVGRQDADPGRQGFIRQLRHPLRQDGARSAARSSRRPARPAVRPVRTRGRSATSTRVSWTRRGRRHSAPRRSRRNSRRSTRWRRDRTSRARSPVCSSSGAMPRSRHSPKAISRTRKPRRSSSTRAVSACQTATTT